MNIESLNNRMNMPFFYLPFYDQDYPSEDISLEDFMNLCQKRLDYLKQLDTTEPDVDTTDRFIGVINQMIAGKNAIGAISNTREGKEGIRNDRISHYFLRIAYSRTREMREWFVRAETTLFRARLYYNTKNMQDPTSYLRNLLLENQKKYGKENFPFEEVSKEEFETLTKDPYSREYITEKHQTGALIKVPFEFVTRLVSKRIVLMRNGFAYIEIKDAKILLENFFKMRLNESTKQTKKILPYLEEMNEIVAEFLEKIDSLSLGAKDYSKLNINRKDKINLADLDLLAARSFPLCMREMHKYLRANHHLKHWGRLQYGLFLKGIGLTLEDSIKFWRAEFTKKMTNDKFEKGYLYNIRHSYGKEGKRADYTPWTCAKIIQHSSPGSGEHHGCPFKEYDEKNLKHALEQYKDQKFTDDHIREILEYKRGKHFQVACKNTFLKTHPGATMLDDVGIHPNGYFEASVAYYSKDAISQSLSNKKGNNNMMNNNSNKKATPNSRALEGQSVPGSVTK